MLVGRCNALWAHADTLRVLSSSWKEKSTRSISETDDMLHFSTLRSTGLLSTLKKNFKQQKWNHVRGNIFVKRIVSQIFVLSALR